MDGSRPREYRARGAASPSRSHTVQGSPHDPIAEAHRHSDEDIARSYDAGANSYVRQPVTFEGLVDAVRAMGRYWLEVFELPRDATSE